jgi:hypothetical protein
MVAPTGVTSALALAAVAAGAAAMAAAAAPVIASMVMWLSFMIPPGLGVTLVLVVVIERDSVLESRCDGYEFQFNAPRNYCQVFIGNANVGRGDGQRGKR